MIRASQFKPLDPRLIHPGPIDILRDGIFRQGARGVEALGVGDERNERDASLLKHPVPLIALRIDVKIEQGVAIIMMIRRFRNIESLPIEAVATFPVPFDSVLTGMSALVDGRRLNAEASPRIKARQTYENALDRGKLAVLHEEVLRGIHVISVAQLAPGKEVEISAELIMPLAIVAGIPALRIPVSVGQIYGVSPLLPADDVVVEEGRLFDAEFVLRADSGTPALADGTPLTAKILQLPLDRAIEVRIPGAVFGSLDGIAADGRQICLSLAALPGGDDLIDAAVLFDRSGSTGASVEGAGSLFEAMRHGLTRALGGLRDHDRIALWQFDDQVTLLGTSQGPDAADLALQLSGPGGGTELGKAVGDAIATGARDILVITDGKTWASDVQNIAREGVRISAVLAGEDSLDAMMGHLVAMTGGQLFTAAGADVAPAIISALAAMRIASGGTRFRANNSSPDGITIRRGGVAINAIWRNQPADLKQNGVQSDASVPDSIGRYAAALSLPAMDEAAATQCAIAHGLCTHLTSLILVDEAGDNVQGVPAMRKVPLMVSDSPQPASFLHASRRLAQTSARGANDYQPISGHLRAAQFSVGTEQPAQSQSGDDRNIKPAGVDAPNSRSAPVTAIAALAASIDWTKLGPALSRGNLSGLRWWQWLRLRLYARSRLVRAQADRLGKNNIVVAVAMLAQHSAATDKTADRIARSLMQITVAHDDVQDQEH